jgi:hypothetical protein
MPKYQITIINEHFSDAGEIDAPNVTKAWQKALASAITIAATKFHTERLFSERKSLLKTATRRSVAT